jgi:hypothetical protein
MENINIPAPKFHLYEFVNLYWNEKTYSTKIVARWYDLDLKILGDRSIARDTIGTTAKK